MKKHLKNSKDHFTKDVKKLLAKNGSCKLQEGVKIERINFQADKYTFVKKRAGYSGC